VEISDRKLWTQLFAQGRKFKIAWNLFALWVLKFVPVEEEEECTRVFCLPGQFQGCPKWKWLPWIECLASPGE